MSEPRTKQKAVKTRPCWDSNPGYLVQKDLLDNGLRNIVSFRIVSKLLLRILSKTQVTIGATFTSIVSILLFPM